MLVLGKASDRTMCIYNSDAIIYLHEYCKLHFAIGKLHNLVYAIHIKNKCSNLPGDLV